MLRLCCVVLLACTLRGTHACNLRSSSTCGGTSKQTNSHLTLALVELNPTESPPMFRPKTNLFQVGREKSKDFCPCFFEKSGDFLSLIFLGKIPAFWRKKRGFCFFALLKTERSSFFCCFPCFFSHYPRFFWPIPASFRKKTGKGGSGN